MGVERVSPECRFDVRSFPRKRTGSVTRLTDVFSLAVTAYGMALQEDGRGDLQ